MIVYFCLPKKALGYLIEILILQIFFSGVTDKMPYENICLMKICLEVRHMVTTNKKNWRMFMSCKKLEYDPVRSEDFL